MLLYFVCIPELLYFLPQPPSGVFTYSGQCIVNSELLRIAFAFVDGPEAQATPSGSCNLWPTSANHNHDRGSTDLTLFSQRRGRNGPIAMQCDLRRIQLPAKHRYRVSSLRHVDTTRFDAVPSCRHIATRIDQNASSFAHRTTRSSAWVICDSSRRSAPDRSWPE